MTENELCVVCGEPATHYLGLPLCNNIVCEVTLQQEVREALKELEGEYNVAYA